jgi:glycosyltransferase involved in cell wall biosynthesis
MYEFSINIIVKDQEKFFDCLESIKDLTDDLVIIVDSHASVDTETIAKKYSNKVFIKTFLDYATQRNFAVTKSVHDWIFTIDADEIVSPELYKYLKNINLSDLNFQAFAIKRLNLIFGKTIKHTNWDPNGIVRLFNKQFGTWVGEIHEVWKTTGSIGRIDFSIIHHNYQTIEEFISKLDLYTSSEANQIKKFSFINFLWLPKKEFLRRYVIHAGFLDGYHGMFLSFLMWFYQVSVWVKVWQKQNTT